MIKKRIITFLITFLLLGASFGIVYGLSAAQLSNKSNTVLSFIISLFISLTNMIIQRKILCYFRGSQVYNPLLKRFYVNQPSDQLRVESCDGITFELDFDSHYG